MLKWILLLIPVLLLAGCGGDGGGSTVQTVQAIGQVRGDLWFGYFYILGEQIRETAAHINCLFVNFAGDWSTPAGRQAIRDRSVAYMRQAIDAGIPNVILAIDFLIFTGRQPNAYKGMADAILFVDQCKAAGVWDAVRALYIYDEPEFHGINEATMTQACKDARQFGKPLASFYGSDGPFPGIQALDIVGVDHYGGDVLGRDIPALKARLRPDQRIMLIAGGASPWREDPRPFLAYANRDPQVVALFGFIWGSNWDGRGDPTQVGIRDNGMADVYAEVGRAVKTGKAPPPAVQDAPGSLPGPQDGIG